MTIERFVSSTNIHIRTAAAAIIAVLALSLLIPSSAGAADYPFPVIGSSNYSNDFDAPRSNGKHNAIDIFANKHRQVVSRTDGVITYIPYPEPSWGWMIRVKADNGHEYNYIHLNNDTPGTDNGRGGAFFAYGPDLQSGNRVVKGQLLGYVGDSGNAENTPPHLHFEVIRSNGTHVNPYNGLRDNSYRISQPAQNYPRVGNEIMPSSPTFMGGYTIAAGDIDGDGVDDLVTGPGQGGRWVKTLNESGQLISSFMPNGVNFLGGVDVAAGDIDGDGVDEIITGAGPGGRFVKIFRANGDLVGQFAPNGVNFLGGVDVAAGDIDGDGVDEIITGAGPGGRFVKIFRANGTLIRQFAPYDSLNGVTVATGRFNTSSSAGIVTSARKGGEPRVNVYTGSGNIQSTFNVYSASFRGGVRVEAASVNPLSPHDEIITISQEGGTARTKLSSSTGRMLSWSNYFAEEWWQGHYDVAAGSDGKLYGSMGINRRSTIRPITHNY